MPPHPLLSVYKPILDQLGAATLTPIVRRALRSRTAVPVVWRWDPVSYAAYLPRRLLVHVEGTADVCGGTVPWAAVIKILEPPGAAEPGSGAAATAGWDREVGAYRSGLLADLPGGLGAPRLLHIGRDAAGALWLWLERVQDAFGGNWPPAQYGIAAYHLGRFNGAYSAARPLPRYRWLNRRWAESHSEPALVPDARREVDGLFAHPEVRAAFPAPAADLMRRRLDHQPLFLDVLARLPNTLCHHDASSANHFARRRADASRAADARDAWETVAIDWEDVGRGPVGAEVATLVFGTMRRGAFPAQRAGELAHIVLEHYERGLRDAGWRGDPADVRLGYTAAVALRWVLVPATLRLLASPAAREQAARASGRSAEALLRQRIRLVHFLLDCADDARRLAPRASG